LCGSPSREAANLAKDGYGKVKLFDDIAKKTSQKRHGKKDMAKNAAPIQLNFLAPRAAKAPAPRSFRAGASRQIAPMR
jgi:hypothetical protein